MRRLVPALIVVMVMTGCGEDSESTSAPVVPDGVEVSAEILMTGPEVEANLCRFYGNFPDAAARYATNRVLFEQDVITEDEREASDEAGVVAPPLGAEVLPRVVEVLEAECS